VDEFGIFSIKSESWLLLADIVILASIAITIWRHN
jgi:hypothetical protein